MDAFEFDDEDFSKPAEAAAPERELVPEGTHEFLIKRCTGGDPFEAALAHEDKRYGWVFCKLPRGQQWAQRIGSTLVSALGMTAAEWASAGPDDVVDRLVRARVYHKVGKSGGRTFVNVAEFLPAEPKAEKSAIKSRPRTAGQKAMDTAKENAPDDIPF